MLFVPSMYVRSAGFFLIGLSNLKNSQSYVWSSESVPFVNRPSAFTIINVVDCAPTLVTGLFYIFFSRNWFIIYAINIVFSISAFGLAFICPESPRWYLYNH